MPVGVGDCGQGQARLKGPEVNSTIIAPGARSPRARALHDVQGWFGGGRA
jgi:hypothetical protein